VERGVVLLVYIGTGNIKKGWGIMNSVFLVSRMRQAIIRLSVVILVFVLVFSSMAGVNVQAASYVEKEPNNSFAQANALTLNVDYSCSFSTYEGDYYKITTPSDGYVSFTYQNPKSDGVSGPLFRLYKSDTTTELQPLREFYWNTDKKQTTDAIGLPKGTYYVYLTGSKASKYTFRANFTASSVWEKELNDTQATANTISTNTMYYGGSRDYTDYDWYKVTLDSPGYISISFQHKYINKDTSSHRVKIYGVNTDTEYYSGTFSAKDDTLQTTPRIGVPKGTYYVRIDGTHKEGYNFKLNYKASNYWETEFNDNFGTADSIKTDTTYYGTIISGNDDYYKFKINKQGYVSVSLQHPYAESGSYYVSLIGSDKTTELYDDTFAGKTKTLTTGVSIGLPAGTYYLKIDGWGDINNKVYNFKLNYKESTLWETEENNTIATADPIKLGTKYYGSGSPGHYPYDDYFKFTLSKKEEIEVESNGARSVTVYKSDGKTSVISNYVGDGGKSVSSKAKLSTGVYYVKVYPISGKGYNFTVRKAEAKPVSAKLRRVYGQTRYETAFGIAEQYMKDTGQAKLTSIIVARGDNFPDALSASYLAKAKKAPVILWTPDKNKQVQGFIKKNVKTTGTVYLLGGPSVVGNAVKKGMAHNFTRKYGQDRFGTNIEVLKTVGVKNEELLVCDGFKFENALIASGTGKPILLVQKGGLTKEQKSWLNKNKTKISKITIIGNTSSVDTTTENALKAYGSVSRLSAGTADAVSAKVAGKYFKKASQITIAISDNWPDGLAGGPLAIANKGPILLVNNKKYASTLAYTKSLPSLTRATVLGGTMLVSDATVKKLAKGSTAKWTVVYKK